MRPTYSQRYTCVCVCVYATTEWYLVLTCFPSKSSNIISFLFPIRISTHYIILYIQYAFYDQSIIHATKPLFIYRLFLLHNKTVYIYIHTRTSFANLWCTDEWLILRCQMTLLMSKLKFSKWSIYCYGRNTFILHAIQFEFIKFYRQLLKSNSVRCEKWHFYQRIFLM